MTPLLFLLVMIGGAVGSLARFGAVHLTRRTRFPWAVLALNAVGSLVCGAVIAWSASLGTAAAAQWSLVVATGFCGGLTTYSTLAIDTVRLWQAGRWRAAFGNTIANLALGIGAAALGIALGLAIG